MGSEIFLHPVNNELYVAVRDDVASIVANLLPSPFVQVSESAAKLDAAFNHAVYTVLNARREYFSPLEDALQHPSLASATLEFEWARYRSALIERFEVAPVFGQSEQSVSLAQIYTALGGRWCGPENDDEPEMTEDLDVLLSDWATAGEQSDPVRLIFGGPGSGKSSLAKSLAATLALRPDVRPILIELQHTNALGDLRQAIEQRLVHEAEWFHSDPLSQKDDNRPFVFIFDGLDELVVPGTTAASRVADGFVVALKALMRTFNSQGKLRARAVITGRSAIMHSFAKSYEVPPYAAIEVLGFLYEEYISDGVRQFDKRPEWWNKFSLAYGYPSELPEALKDTKLQDITNEPLLCFLMAMSGYMTSNWAEAAENTNRIYAKLVGEIWERRWGQGEHATSGRVGPSLKLKSKEDFDLLMEALALAAWWGGENKIATKAMFDWALDVTRAHDIWRHFKEDDGDEMQNLALMFYMRRSDSDAQGVEFTHKTFSEYLVARFMMRFAHTKIARQLANRDIDQTEAAARWCTFAVQSRADSGVIRFLRNEARLLGQQALEMIHARLTDLLSFSIRVGLPLHKSTDATFRSLVEGDARGKANALATLSSTTLALREMGVDARVKIDWADDRTAPARLIGNLVDFRGSANSEDLLFPNFDFSTKSGIFATCIFACGADFSGSVMRNAVLYRSFLSQCDFTNADLSSSTMDRSDLRDSLLRGANLSRSRLQYAGLSRADLTGANLEGVLLEGAIISGATLDFGWWDKVDLRTFANPPKGDPNITNNGSLLLPDDDAYPDLAAIYSAKAATAREAMDEDIPF